MTVNSVSCADVVIRRRGSGSGSGFSTHRPALPTPGPPFLGRPADLGDALGVSRTRLSNHLACLRDCGLVITVPDGRRIRYAV